MDIQNALIFIKEKSGMTQKQIAEALGCSQPNVCDMLNGHVNKSRPTYVMVESVKALARKHRISMKSFI